MTDKLKGYLWGIFAAAAYGTNPLFALPLYSRGMDPDSVLFFRYLLSLPLLACLLKLQGGSFKIQKRALLPMFILGMMVALSSLSLFVSYKYIGASIASTLLFMYPVFVAVIMALFFKERISVRIVFCIVVALAGIGLLYKGDGGAALNTAGIVWIFISALSYAIYLVAVNHSELRKLPTNKLTFYLLCFGTLLFLARARFGLDLQVPDTLFEWADLVGFAILPTAFSFYGTTRAIQYIGSTPTAILGALEPATAVFLSVMIFAEPFTLRIFAGMAMIICSVAMIVANGARK